MTYTRNRHYLYVCPILCCASVYLDYEIFPVLSRYDSHLCSSQMSVTVIINMRELAHGGACIGEVVSADSPELVGKKAFVRDTLPGEQVEAFVTADRKSFIEAALKSIVRVSEHRAQPPCPWFGVCGGCDLQHATIEHQREIKRRMIAGTLRVHLKGAAPEVVSAGGELPQYGYRGRITLHLAANGDLGFYRAGSGEVVAIERCLLAREELNAAIKALDPLRRELARYFGEVVLDCIDGAACAVLRRGEDRSRRGPPDRLLLDAAALFEWLVVERRGGPERGYYRGARRELEQLPPIGHFSQVNDVGNALLIRTVASLIKPGPVLELYAGAGNFSFALAEQGCTVCAVEVDGALCRRGLERSIAAGLERRLTFVEQSCEKYLAAHQAPPTVLLDPPRSGAQRAVQLLAAQQVVQIIYVSCNLPSLARDLKLLLDAGFRYEKLSFIDMFPQTHHVETVSILTR